jgi:hypothetical protein
MKGRDGSCLIEVKRWHMPKVIQESLVSHDSRCT